MYQDNRKPLSRPGRAALVLLALLLLWPMVAACGAPAAPEATADRTGTAAASALSATATPAGKPTATATRRATRTPTPALRPAPTRASSLPTVRYQDLPPEAKRTIALIEQGGPFPFERDGIVFQNREGLLPPKPRGYYREYTVITPGSRDRGPRRIVAGAGGELYYTEDHYQSFREVVR
ncbi:MAG: hypothetical protein NZ528_04415 [Caldilineales bacterium]|nr:hypothetical protein [Caldilineales bacterium]MDW8317803.1 ribonuclease domain-containing protein [Anaerolineae bacterium]